MGFKFDEKTLIDNNIFKYEEKLNTQYTRFLDKTPTYVTYFNISVPESSVDLGFGNVEAKIGDNSPLRYNEVKNFPVYGIDTIQLNLQEDEEGLDTDYEGELIILPGTITPYQDDFFIIEHKGKDFLFQITGVDFDTIKSNNFYKATYTIKYVTPEETEKIFRQITGKFTCVADNIGTEDKCIIKDDELQLINKLQALYLELAEKYKMYYYNKKYNSFIYVDSKGYTIYDRYLNMFIQKHGLFYDGETHRSLYLNNEDQSCCFEMEYDRSIYKAYEMRKPKRFNQTKFSLVDIKNMYSVFAYYGVRNCCSSVRFRNGYKDYLDSGLIYGIQSGDIESGSKDRESDMPIYYLQANIPKHKDIDRKYDELDLIIIKYMHDMIDSIYNINMDELEDSIYFDLNWSTFIKIPLALYAIKGYYKLFLRKQ